MIDLNKIKKQWVNFVWSEEQVEKLIREQEHSFDPLIKKFLKDANRLPFVQTQYACSGHARKVMILDEKGKIELFNPYIIFITSIKKMNITDACNYTLDYIKNFYSSLKFMDNKEKSELMKIKTELVEILNGLKKQKIKIEDAKSMFVELSIEIEKVKYWNEIVVDEGEIIWYIFNLNKFTKKPSDKFMIELKDKLISQVTDLIIKTNEKSKKLHIESNLKSEDKWHKYDIIMF